MLRIHHATALLRLSVALFVPTIPSVARAQMDAGSLRALVADQSGGVVPGATVTVTNAATGVARVVISDNEGYATFSPTQRGSYDLRVELNGFRTREIRAITVDVNDSARRLSAVVRTTAAITR